MSDRRQKRKYDVGEVDSNVSQGILDVLNENFPKTYLVLQMCNYLNTNPIPTDINIYNKCKNNPGELIRDFYVYLDRVVKMFVNDLYFTVVSGEYLAFFDTSLSNGKIDRANVTDQIDDYGCIFLAPKILEEIFPVFSSCTLYGTGMNSIQDSKPFLIPILNKVFGKFCSDFNSKYNSNISILAQDDDVITIEFKFSIV